MVWQIDVILDKALLEVCFVNIAGDVTRGWWRFCIVRRVSSELF